jgi:hypothetical protein
MGGNEPIAYGETASHARLLHNEKVTAVFDREAVALLGQQVVRLSGGTRC